MAKYAELVCVGTQLNSTIVQKDYEAQFIECIR